MPISGETGGKLAEAIKKAIDDHEITNMEYERILALADADGIVDAQERKMLANLQEMMSNGTVKRVPDKP
jgi:tellurite resistance protein